MLQFPSSPTGRIIGSARKWRGKTLTVNVSLVQYHKLSVSFSKAVFLQHFNELAALSFPKHVLAPHSQYITCKLIYNENGNFSNLIEHFHFVAVSDFVHKKDTVLSIQTTTH